MIFEIFLDLKGDVVSWVGNGLKEHTCWVGQNMTLGIKREGRLIAGIVFHDIRVRRDVWLTIFSTDKKWCNRRVLRAVFNIAFNFLKCQRVSVKVDALNFQSQKLVEGLGFKKEGILRSYEDNGHDGFIYSMLKNECIWRTKGHE